MKKLYRPVCDYLNDFIFIVSQHQKLSLRYLIALVPLTVYLGMLCFIGKNTPAEFFLKGFQVIAFMGAGILHLYLLNKKISFQRLRFFGEGIVATLSLSVTICFTLLLFYLFTDNSMAVMAFTSSLGFAFPHICFHTWFLFKNIPPKEYPLWISPLNIRDENEVLMPEMVPFIFLLQDKAGDDQEKKYYKAVPEEWKLGKAFYSILKDDDTHIEYKDRDGNSYGWEFHRFLFKGIIKKRLEPEDTMSDNMIRKNSIVYVTRVKVRKTEEPIVHKIQYKAISTAKNLSQAPAKQKMELIGDSSKTN